MVQGLGFVTRISQVYKRGAREALESLPQMVHRGPRGPEISMLQPKPARKLGSSVVPFCPFSFWVPLLKTKKNNKKGYPYCPGATGEPRKNVG